MDLDIAKELAALRRMTVTQLRTRFVEVFGEQTRSSNRQHLIRRIAWRLQALEYGTLSQRARRRAAELADEANLRLTAPAPGTAPGIYPEAAAARYSTVFCSALTAIAP